MSRIKQLVFADKNLEKLQIQELRESIERPYEYDAAYWQHHSNLPTTLPESIPETDELPF